VSFKVNNIETPMVEKFGGTILKVENLSSGYSDVQILKSVNFSVKEGEIVAIFGPNGSGKSTLLKSILGQCDLLSGKVVFQGKDITRIPTDRLVSLGLSCSPQGRKVFETMTVLENLEVGATTNVSKADFESKIDYIFRVFPVLSEKKFSRASTLSGGQQQLLSLGMVLTQSPKLLILDEPLSGLSPKNVSYLLEKILQIRDSGSSILLVEHNIKRISEIADKVILMENGQIIQSGRSGIAQIGNIAEIFMGRKRW